MIEQLQVNRLRAGTLFQIYYTGYVVTLYPISLVAGTCATFGSNTLMSNGIQLHGWKAAVDMIVAPPLIALFFALWSLLGTWPGLWLFSKFKKTSISFYTDTPDRALQRTSTGERLPPLPHG